MTADVRVAVRVVLLDPASRVLLFESRDLFDDPDSDRFWFTVGGGVDAAESLVHAAARELAEETGLRGATLAGPFHQRRFSFLNDARVQHQVEHFFAARVDDDRVDTTGWTALERRTISALRWWSAEELAAAQVRYFPDNLLTLMQHADRLV